MKRCQTIEVLPYGNETDKIIKTKFNRWNAHRRAALLNAMLPSTMRLHRLESIGSLLDFIDCKTDGKHKERGARSSDDSSLMTSPLNAKLAETLMR